MKVSNNKILYVVWARNAMYVHFDPDELNFQHESGGLEISVSQGGYASRGVDLRDTQNTYVIHAYIHTHTLTNTTLDLTLITTDQTTKRTPSRCSTLAVRMETLMCGI